MNAEMEIEKLARAIAEQKSPESALATAATPHEIARALYLSGWQPPRAESEIPGAELHERLQFDLTPDQFRRAWEPTHGDWSPERLAAEGFPRDNPTDDQPGGRNNPWRKRGAE